MNDNSTSNDITVSRKRDLTVCNVDFGDTVITSFYISKIASVTNFIGWSSVILTSWIVVRTSRDATVSVVSKLVNMEAMRTLGESTDLSGYFDWAGCTLKSNENKKLIKHLKYVFRVGCQSLSGCQFDLHYHYLKVSQIRLKGRNPA